MRTLLAVFLLASPPMVQKSPLENRTAGKEIAHYGEIWRLGAGEATALTMAVADGKLELMWGTTAASAPIKVK